MRTFRFELDPAHAPEFVSSHEPFEVELTGQFCGIGVFRCRPGSWIFSEERTPVDNFDNPVNEDELIWKAVARRLGT